MLNTKSKIEDLGLRIERNDSKPYILTILILGLIYPTLCCALNFGLPLSGNTLVGEIKIAQVQPKENFSDVAERFDVGYYEILEANPGVDPSDKPPPGAILVIPTRYVLPLELVSDTIVINLAEMRLYYQPKNEHKVYVFPVGIGRENWETPTGAMTIIEKKEKPTWRVPDSIYNFRKSIGKEVPRVVPPGPDNPLGSYSLRLSQQKYLIHGTNDPEGVGRRSTAGCMRLYEPDIKQLYNMVEIGTKVVIMNKPYKAGWNGKKLYLEAHKPLHEQHLEMGDDMKLAFDVITDATKNCKIKINWPKAEKIAREHLTVPRAIN